MQGLAVPNVKEDTKFKQYLMQLKEETAKRLMNILYNPEWGTLDLKFWLSYSKRKFLKMDFEK